MLKIGIDCDGVLGKFTRSFALVINSIWPGKVPDDFEPSDWEYLRDGKLTKEEFTEAWKKLGTVNNFWLLEAPYRENVDYLAEWLVKHREDSTVYYITSRMPTEGYSVMEQTQRWLDSWNLLKKNTSVLPVVTKPGSTTPAKNLVIEGLGISAHLDDYLPTVRSLGDVGWCLERPWNRRETSSQDKVVKTLAEFLEKVAQ